MNINEIIKPILREVESTYQMGGLSDGLYADYATDVAKKAIKQILEAEVERLNSKILDVLDTKDQGGLYSDLSFPEVCTYNTCLHHQIGHLTNIINNLK